MITLTVVLLSISVLLSVAFFVYGFNAIHLVLRSRHQKRPEAKVGAKPTVAVHLPIYNEMYVVGRLVRSCVAMADTYGKDMVSIALIDDSTDETAAEIDALVSEYSSMGFKIRTIRRTKRTGFKAGALQAALEQTEEDFIAVFDADFIPTPDYLERIMPYFSSPEIGFVQARWAHLNRGYNTVTKAIAVGADAHFFVEQPGRWNSGYLLNFNGSAGVLRREAILRAGGWQSDTLAEDLDVSYRIQLAGYKPVYVEDLAVPAEIPPTVTALKRQQGRWARGSIQTAKKLGPRIMSSKKLSVRQKAQAGIHLTYYMVHPLMVVSFLVAVTAALTNSDAIKVGASSTIGALFQTGQQSPTNLLINALEAAPWVLFFILIAACTVAVLFYGVEALRVQKMSLKRNVPTLLLLIVIGYGISISNSVGALSGLFLSRTGEFSRTPKYAIARQGDKWRGKKYQIRLQKTTVLEGGAVLLAGVAMARALQTGNLGILPILLVYAVCYGFVFVLTVRHSLYSASR